MRLVELAGPLRQHNTIMASLFPLSMEKAIHCFKVTDTTSIVGGKGGGKGHGGNMETVVSIVLVLHLTEHENKLKIFDEVHLNGIPSAERLSSPV